MEIHGGNLWIELVSVPTCWTIQPGTTLNKGGHDDGVPLAFLDSLSDPLPIFIIVHIMCIRSNQVNFQHFELESLCCAKSLDAAADITFARLP